ncbi:hypothetical protein ALC62_01635 [Cyphomyrmex costatus]|uniref:Uncharacterized protein n=1 Tax=Cyphomyrmex costatus TaxID=456900 RepID=A0A195D3F6_9HYME|nr:hypothetical protein ALC62_01635 [Cyphomyrmex costatus]
MGRHAKRLIGMLLLRPRCINCAATTLEYTMHFDPSHTTLFDVVAYVVSAKWVNLIYRGGNMYVDIDDETPTKELCSNVERNAINAKYVLTVKEDGFGKICRGALFFSGCFCLVTKTLIKIVGYVNVPRQCYKMSNTESRISHEARQMRAVAREVFILRGVCCVIKRTGKRRQRVFRRKKLFSSLHQSALIRYQFAPRPDKVNGKVHKTLARNHDTAIIRKLWHL